MSLRIPGLGGFKAPKRKPLVPGDYEGEIQSYEYWWDKKLIEAGQVNPDVDPPMGLKKLLIKVTYGPTQEDGRDPTGTKTMAFIRFPNPNEEDEDKLNRDGAALQALWQSAGLELTEEIEPDDLLGRSVRFHVDFDKEAGKVKIDPYSGFPATGVKWFIAPEVEEDTTNY